MNFKTALKEKNANNYLTHTIKNKGISLIVLIITIVVIIILATAIIVNLAQTNIIENSNDAVTKNNIATIKDAYNLYIFNEQVATKKSLIGKGRISNDITQTTYSYKQVGQKDKYYKRKNITLEDIGIGDTSIESILISNNEIIGIELNSKCYTISGNSTTEIEREIYEEKSVVIPENDALLGKISKLKTSGITQIAVTGKNNETIEEKIFSIDTIVYDGDLVLDGQTNVEGSTLENNIYEFGDSTADVATANTEAQNMVVLKVNGDLTINEGITLTACKSESGYGGPKGMLIYCTGTITNNGTITMTARGAKATGENVYLWKNEDDSFEYIPAIGASGGEMLTGKSAGVTGASATLARQTAGGGSGAAIYKKGGKGGNGTSYSGGTGGGGTYSSDYNGTAGSDIGAKGGKAYNNNSGGYESASGGTGNPGGAGAAAYRLSASDYVGNNGTGGLLVIYANNVVNSGDITSNGTDGAGAGAGGGASGAGSINIFYYESYSNNGEITADGGIGTGKKIQSYDYMVGGNGGTGAISVGTIESGTYVSTYKNY